MKRTLEIFSGNYEWLSCCSYDIDEFDAETPESWMDMEHRILAIRDEFIAGEWAEKEWMFGPCMARVDRNNEVSDEVHLRCATLPWGDEEWTRVDDYWGRPFADERKLRDAFAGCAFMFRDLLEGLEDGQTDNAPLAVSLYRRPAGARSLPSALAQDPDAFEDNLIQLAAALYQEGAEGWRVPLSQGLSEEGADFLGTAASMTVAELIESGPLRYAFRNDDWERNWEMFEYRGLELAISEAICGCEQFVALCVPGEAGAGDPSRLAPCQAMRVINAAVVAVRDDGNFDPGSFEGYLDDAEPWKAEILEFLNDGAFKACVAQELGLDEAAVDALLPLPLQWTESATPRVAMERAQRHVAEMEQVLKKQIAALAAEQGDADLSGKVVPLALSDSDLQPRALSLKFDNDHQPALSYMWVADGWALLVCHKSSSC